MPPANDKRQIADAVALRGRFSTTPISPINCPAPTVPRRMGSPSSSRSMSTAPLRRRKTLSAGSPSLKRTCPSAKCARVIAALSLGDRWRTPEGKLACPHRLARTPAPTRPIIDGIYYLRNPRNTAASIQGLPSDAHLAPAEFDANTLVFDVAGLAQSWAKSNQ